MKPSGSVVFLFSDIEGSTARWDAMPEAMEQALRHHDTLMRSAVESHGGYVFKTIGDAFCVSFSTAREAAQGALAAQRSFLDADWSSVEGLRVRMAIHAGRADERDDDYFGSTVNRSARLLSAAHGGQILLSGVVADLLDQYPVAGTSLRSLGTYRLKDLQQAEHVYQLVAPGLPADFKPVRALDAALTNLPAQSTSFIGRDKDVAATAALLRQATLVTLSGPGGVGKTRLALQSATEMQDAMHDGVWFVNLAPLNDAAFVVSSMLSALGIAPGGDANALDALITHLRNREVLLVLDNCEHVVAEVARVVSAIREKCRRVTVLATSREVLRLPGERVYRLPSLAKADSVRLFVERAQAVAPDFAVTPADALALEDICRHLDGIPLAIELAAARVRILGLGELLGRLGERFRLLRGGDRTALPRQQTLLALIDWSFNLLSDEEKRLFRRLSIFSGTFTTEAASSVCADEALDGWAILDLLSSLVDKSLLVAGVEEARHRYHLLESIHEYAQQKLSETAGEAIWLAVGHATFFAEAVATVYANWDVRPAHEAVAGAIDDLPNIRAALEWTLSPDRDSHAGARLAADAAPIFLQLSLLDEGIGWCGRALRKAGQLPSAVHARLEYMLSMFHNNQGHFEYALEAAEKALRLFRFTEDVRGTIRALSQVAQQYARAGRFNEARPFADEAIARARSLGDAKLLGSITRRCAAALPPTQIDEARALFSGAVALLRSLREDDEVRHVLEWWAEAEAAAACFDRAVELGTESLAETADTVARMYRTSNVAGYLLAANDFERAQPFIREALTLAVQAHHHLLITVGLAYSATTRLPDDPQEAARLFGYARARMSELAWEGICSDRRARENIVQGLNAKIGSERLSALFAQGAAWDQDDALARASSRRASSEPNPSGDVRLPSPCRHTAGSG